MRRVAILAGLGFPLHVIPGLEAMHTTSGHYASWLPALAAHFGRMQDLDVHWVVLNEKISSCREIVWDRQTFHILPTASFGRAGSLYAKDRRAINELLLSIGPDVVHGWGSEDVDGLAAALSRYPNIVSLQGILSQYALRSRLAPREYFQAAIELFTINKAGVIVCESNWACRVARRRRLRGKVIRIDYGVQDLFFDIKWEPKAERPIVAFCGSVYPRKGIKDLVEAFRDPFFDDAELLVLGSGKTKYVGKMQRIAGKNVRWLGQVSIEESARAMASAWCFALPTRADTGPMAVKEARVIGLPVISTACAGSVDYITHGENGFLVKPGQVHKLRHWLKYLLADLNRCRDMGAAHWQEQRRSLSPQRTAEQMRELYLSL